MRLLQGTKYTFSIVKSKYKIPNRSVKPVRIQTSQIAHVTERENAVYNPGIERFLKNMRGVFPIYKPPHTTLDTVKDSCKKGCFIKIKKNIQKLNFNNAVF